MRLQDGSKAAIIECFHLNKQAPTKIDLQISEEEYTRLRRTYRSDELPIYMKRGVKNRAIPIFPSATEPFFVIDFQFYFRKTYFYLYQLLGIDA